MGNRHVLVGRGFFPWVMVVVAVQEAFLQLPCVSSMHSWHLYPFLTQSSFNLLFFFCIKSILDNSLVSWLWLGEAQLCISLAQYILVCPFSPSIYLSSPLFTVCSLCLSIHYPLLISLSHLQFPVSTHPWFIYLYSISPSTLLSHSVLSFPDHSDHPDPYHTLHLYKYSSYKLL